MTILEILATGFGIGTGIANIPQIIKIFRNKSAKDISIITMTIFLLSSIVWLLYGIELSSFALISANILYVITYVIIIFGFVLYGRKKE